MTTFLGQSDNGLQTRTTLPNASTAAVVLDMSVRTDRHQLVLMSSSTQSLDVEIANPEPLTSGDFPAASALAATEWVAPEGTPPLTLDTPQAKVLTIVGRYLRLTPNGGALTADVIAAYRPLPPTGG